MPGFGSIGKVSDRGETAFKTVRQDGQRPEEEGKVVEKARPTRHDGAHL